MNDYYPIFITLYIILGIPMIAYFGSLTLGYFDQRKTQNPKWSQRRNWIILITCLIAFPLIVVYENYNGFGISLGNKEYTIAHMLYIICYLFILKELIAMWKHGMDQGSIVFVQIANTICLVFLITSSS